MKRETLYNMRDCSCWSSFQLVSTSHTITDIGGIIFLAADSQSHGRTLSRVFIDPPLASSGFHQD